MGWRSLEQYREYAAQLAREASSIDDQDSWSHIALGYMPHELAVKGKGFQVEYFGETYPVEVVGEGYEPLYDPENIKPRT